MRIKKVDVLAQILIFFVALLLHESVNLLMRSPWAMGDELGVLATGAHFAGYDWSSVFQAPNGATTEVTYYAGGFGIFLTPLFMFIKGRTYLLYQSILLVCALVQSIPSVIAYRILRYTFKIENRVFCAFIAVASCFFVTSRATNAMNENALILSMWIATYILVLLVGYQKRKKCLLSICLAFVLGYSYTLHSRSLIMVAGTFFVIIIFSIIYKKRLVVWTAFIPCYLLFQILAIKYNAFIQEAVFKINENTIVYNTSSVAAESIISQFWSLFTENHWRAIGDILLTNVFGLNVVSTTLFLTVFFVWICRLFLNFRMKRKSEIYNETDENFIVIGSFTFFCIWLMICLYTIQGLGNTIAALEDGVCTRAHFYLRYPGAFCGPVILLSAVIMQKNWFSIKKMLCSLLGMAICAIYTCWSILPRISENYDKQFDFYNFFSPWAILGYGEYMSTHKFYCVLIIMLVLGIFIGLLILKRKFILYAVLLTSLFVYQYMYISIKFDAPSSRELHFSVISTATMFRENKDLVEEVGTIYFPLLAGRWEIPYVVQYYIPELKVMRSMPDSNEENAVVIAFRELEDSELLSAECYLANLDDGSYLYVFGENSKEVFEGIGIEFK